MSLYRNLLKVRWNKHTCIRLACICIFLLLMVSPADAQIRVGSKRFPESRLLAEIAAQLIEQNTDLKVQRKLGLGGTSICFEAIKTGEIDIYPEYTGTAYTAILNNSMHNQSSEETFNIVKRQLQKQYNLTLNTPLGFNNTYALAISGKYNIDSISELKKVEDEIEVGFTHEFLERPDGFPGLVEHYNLDFSNVKGIEHGLAYHAVEQGVLDMVDAYSTDGKLEKYHLQLLVDDKDFFPPYDASFVVRKDVLLNYSQLAYQLELLGNRISNQKMRDLNYQVEVKGRTFGDVAHEFLVEQNLISEDQSPNSRMLNTLTKQTGQHLLLTITATLLAILLGIPVGLIAARYRKMASIVLSVSGVIQTIPSLALLGFMIPLFGIGVKPAIAALFLYALLPIVRNTYTGITNIDSQLKESGTAMGMNKNQLLFKLELPLSVRVIMAGIRTAMVINIGTATLAAFIGAGGLGESIITGISLNDNNTILMGAVPAALLALLVDYILSKFEQIIQPKGIVS